MTENWRAALERWLNAKFMCPSPPPCGLLMCESVLNEHERPCFAGFRALSFLSSQSLCLRSGQRSTALPATDIHRIVSELCAIISSPSFIKRDISFCSLAFPPVFKPSSLSQKKCLIAPIKPEYSDVSLKTLFTNFTYVSRAEIVLKWALKQKWKDLPAVG